MRNLLALLFLLGFQPCVRVVHAQPQQVTTSPAWLMSSAPPVADFLPQEYNGAFPDNARRQFKSGRAHAAGNHCRLWATTLSGIIGVSDLRASSNGLFGWDTSFSRVHSIQLVGEPDSDPNVFLLCVFDSNSATSRLVELHVPSSGAITQSNIGVPSPPNSLWTCASRLRDNSIVFYDGQTHVIRKMVDLNLDGTPETIDSTFLVSVPQDKLSNSIAREVNPIGWFSIDDQSRLLVHPRSRRRPHFLVAGSHGTDWGIVPQITTESKGIGFDGTIVKGQQRIFVFGSAGEEFRVYRFVDGT